MTENQQTPDSAPATEATSDGPVRVPNVRPGAVSGLDAVPLGSNAQAAHDANEQLDAGVNPDTGEQLADADQQARIDAGETYLGRDGREFRTDNHEPYGATEPYAAVEPADPDETVQVQTEQDPDAGEQKGDTFSTSAEGVEWVKAAQDSDTAGKRADQVYAAAQARGGEDLEALSAQLTAAVHGDRSAGQTALVGEQGPEASIPQVGAPGPDTPETPEGTSAEGHDTPQTQTEPASEDQPGNQ